MQKETVTVKPGSINDIMSSMRCSVHQICNEDISIHMSCFGQHKATVL